MTTTVGAAAVAPVASVLTAEDLATWERDGGVIVKKAVPDTVTATGIRGLCPDLGDTAALELDRAV